MSRVLIVDDQLISRMILEQLIRSIGDETEAVSFADPVKALEWAKENRHDLVLTDLKMPNMSGVEFTQWLRKTPTCVDVPVIVITCMDDQTTKYRALEAGATDFLTKPIDHHECRARCRNLLKLRQQQSIIRDRARWLEKEITEKTRELQLRERETLLRLAKAGEYRDSDTNGHVLRMAYTARLIAETLGKDAEYCDIIEQAAPMHDIGKIGVPDRILLKPGRLDAHERSVMMQHTRIGYEILRDSPSMYLQFGATIAWCHHEKYAGDGYPRGLKGDEIPIEARIVAIADVFDALLSERPYKQPWPVEQALDLIRKESGRHFDPECVEAMLLNLDRIVASRSLLEFDTEPKAG
ncbi:MAG: response regulator [Chromatiaceae bacterium]|nr:response regulator [Gammaproteobacteria bacterium]MCP5304178.1 response regulator [Chromatiaceae bacterium]MCP5313903.1 response regulator [Chromatiaceae bacterium]